MKPTVLLSLCGVALLVSMLAAAVSGAYDLGLSEWFDLLLHPSEPSNPYASAVLWDIRMPRIVLAVVVGASLAVAGAVMQGIFANPLAEPSLVGVSSGAAVVAVAVIVIGATALGIWVQPVAAFVGGVLASVGVYFAARYQGRTEVVTLILTGVALNAFAGALIGLLMSVSDDAELRSIAFWTLGSVSTATWPAVFSVLPLTLAGIVGALCLARRLDLLAIGERSAAHLGVNVEATRRWAILITASLTAAAVAVAGIIGFVGLVVPHAVRLVIGPTHRLLLPTVAFSGGILLLWSDVLARTIAAPREIPLGVVTALIGSPVFFWLLRREHTRRGAWA